MLARTLCRITVCSALALIGCPTAPERPSPPDTNRHYVDDLSGEIEATVLSFPPGLIDRAEANALTGELTRSRPGRQLVVLSRDGLSPWPRDPFLFFWRAERPLLLTRPNRQTDREGDVVMADEVARAWLDPLDSTAPLVEAAPLPFHAGQLLTDPRRVWLSIHSLETDAVRRLGLEGVPAQRFDTAVGIAPYLESVNASAEELGRLLGRQPAWVHPVEPNPELLAVLAAGAGLDLDSYLTFLPGGRAYVGSMVESRKALSAATSLDLESLRTFYGLRLGARPLAEALLVANSDSRAAALDRYFDLVASHLAVQNLAVDRIPLIRVPTDLFADREGVDYSEFFLSWNNVVLEQRGGPRAEGFALQFPSVDRAMADRFERSGVPFTALPPLRRSIVLGGGYRCASNHLRKL